MLLRLADAALADGRVAGVARIVESGEECLFRDGEDLVRFLNAAALTLAAVRREPR